MQDQDRGMSYFHHVYAQIKHPFLKVVHRIGDSISAVIKVLNQIKT